MDAEDTEGETRLNESYGAISFWGSTQRGPFYPLILNGEKRQTIREPRKDGRDHVKVGKFVKLYWKVRRKPEQKPGEPHFLGYAKVTHYEFLNLPDMWNDEENAIADGFISLEEFRDWFYPGWRNVHRLDDVVEAWVKLKNYEYSTRILMNWGRRTGKNTLVDFLEEKFYRIKWAWPLLEVS